jgi:hypothetical protein
MASTKKDIDAFQKAMLSNTKVIGSSNEEKAPATAKRRSTKAKVASAGSLEIPQELYKKYEDLAKELNIMPNEAINLALSHFLDLKEFLKS